MKIENNILEISKTMFTNKHNWEFVTDEQKEQFFFIFNRYFSRRHLEFSQLINDKNINKSVAMDLWFHYMKDQPYPQWFWPKTKKTTKSNEEENFSEEIRKVNNLTEEEFKFIMYNFPDEVNEEINYLKLQKNGSKREKVVHSKGTK
jgi:hypothetical protein